MASEISSVATYLVNYIEWRENLNMLLLRNFVWALRTKTTKCKGSSLSFIWHSLQILGPQLYPMQTIQFYRNRTVFSPLCVIVNRIKLQTIAFTLSTFVCNYSKSFSLSSS